MAIQSYRELIVWQKSMDLLLEIYRITKEFPREELYGFTSQMRRSALSISSNIAEGRTRGTRKDFRQFLIVAQASGAELETQIEAAKRLQFIHTDNCRTADGLLLEVMKMLNKMVVTLNA